MSKDIWFEKTAASAHCSTTESAQLLVLHSDRIITHPLPASGQLKVGRSQNIDVAVDDLSMSREHVLLTLRPSSEGAFHFAVRDLGSSNGTKLRGESLVADRDYPFQPGDAIELGSTTLVVKLGKPTTKLWRLLFARILRASRRRRVRPRSRRRRKVHDRPHSRKR